MRSQIDRYHSVRMFFARSAPYLLALMFAGLFGPAIGSVQSDRAKGDTELTTAASPLNQAVTIAVIAQQPDQVGSDSASGTERSGGDDELLRYIVAAAYDALICLGVVFLAIIALVIAALFDRDDRR